MSKRRVDVYLVSAVTTIELPNNSEGVDEEKLKDVAISAIKRSPKKSRWKKTDTEYVAIIVEVEEERCGAFAEAWQEIGKPEGWEGCSLVKGHEGNHSDG